MFMRTVLNEKGLTVIIIYGHYTRLKCPAKCPKCPDPLAKNDRFVRFND